MNLKKALRRAEVMLTTETDRQLVRYSLVPRKTPSQEQSAEG